MGNNEITNPMPLTTPWPAGALIRKARKQHGMSQRDLAEISGLSQSTVTHIESGWRYRKGHKLPLTTTIDQIVKLATVSGADVEQVLIAAGVDRTTASSATPTLMLDVAGLSAWQITLINRFVELVKGMPNNEQGSAD